MKLNGITMLDPKYIDGLSLSYVGVDEIQIATVSPELAEIEERMQELTESG